MTDLPDGVRTVSVNGRPAIDVDVPAARARVSLDGAQVLSWAPEGRDDVLWLSPDAQFAAGAAIRGGIPLCLPWFGAGPAGNKTPAHGTARTSEWTLASATRSGDGAVLALGYAREDYSASLRVAIGTELALEITTTNHADVALPLEEAFHAYLATSDVRRVTLAGLAGASYRDKNDGGARRTQEGDVVVAGPTDRVYHSGVPVILADPGAGRVIEIAPRDAASTVVWNPWEQGAAALADVPDDAWPAFLCVEAANVGDDATLLPPGASHTIAVAYRVKDLT